MSVFISGKLVIQISDELRADNQNYCKNINEKMPSNGITYGALNCNFVLYKTRFQLIYFCNIVIYVCSKHVIELKLIFCG